VTGSGLLAVLGAGLFLLLAGFVGMRRTSRLQRHR
jgi:hypothetical protein